MREINIIQAIAQLCSTEQRNELNFKNSTCCLVDRAGIIGHVYSDK